MCFVVFVAIVGGIVFVQMARGFSARAEPSIIEIWTARKARSMAIPAEAKLRINPIANNTDVLAEARAHWADREAPAARNALVRSSPPAAQVRPHSGHPEPGSTISLPLPARARQIMVPRAGSPPAGPCPLSA